MTSGLPNNKSMWMRAFYGFGPEHDGYDGLTKQAGRHRMLRDISDGDLILIYGSGSAETEKALQSYVLGFMRVVARPIMGCRQILARLDAADYTQLLEGTVNLWYHDVRRILKRFGYPPDLSQEAVQIVLEQAETLLREIA